MKFICSRTLAVSFLGAAACLFTNTSEAAFITPSAVLDPGSIVLPPLTAAAPGAVLAITTAPFNFSSNTGTAVGSLVSAVYKNPSGTLDFYYQVFDLPSSTANLTQMFDSAFTGVQSAVALRLDGSTLLGTGFVSGGVIPTTATRDSVGATVSFNFLSPNIQPGTTSAVLVVSTDASSFGMGLGGVVDDVVFVPSFQPVPEPRALILVCFGLIGVVGLGRCSGLV